MPAANRSAKRVPPMRITRDLRNCLIIVLTAGAARADIHGWHAEVLQGAPARYVDASNDVQRGNVDLGPNPSTSGATYEFCVRAQNHNAGAGPATTGSSALIGVRNTGVGDQGGAKFEQWWSTGQYGVTEFGVADHVCGPNIAGVDLHIAFVCDDVLNLTSVYQDGVLVGQSTYTFFLAGMVGIGQVHDPFFGDADPLEGSLYGVAVYDAALSVSEISQHAQAFHRPPFGWVFCTSNPNSTGQRGRTLGAGSEWVNQNQFWLVADRMPTSAFGFFLVADGFATIPNPGGSQGVLCLGGTVGRFQQQIQSSGPSGRFEIHVDLSAIPTPTGTIQVLSSDSFNFQAWFRDSVGGAPTSNFTDAVRIGFF